MTIVHLVFTGISIITLCGWCFVWFIHLCALIYGKWRLHRPNEPPSPEDLQGVSIIKPLTGVDPHLYSNLETFFNLNYPLYELLFCVQNEQDPAIFIVQSLIAKYPNADSRLFICSKNVGPNGKINNMVAAYDNAKYNLIAINDSGMRMSPETLLDMVSALTPKVGLVHQMPYCCNRKGFASAYEKVFFGTQQSRCYLSANFVGINCTTGMSCLMRKELLDQAGGMSAFGKYLAEDYFFAEAIREKGYQTVICSEPGMQNCGTYSIGEFHKRLIRWSQLRTSMIPMFIIFEPLSECMMLGVLASLAVEYMFDISPLAFFLLHVLVWFLLDYILMQIVENGSLPMSKFEFLVCWLLREVMTLYLTIQSHRDWTIVWRNRKYRVRWGGIAEEIV
ncbi:ceramide glucosyltransferase-like [Octopus vulgaris]|uniref:Ceramide glucosyltransferase-like n=2 Tax=Octopus TaxID=6643 RepID=A0AA36AZ98_OCTVU|nr:ceramide glucosyltransferase [Octopus sinensis]CAI9724017.1 ceramide glucosyltransferase-like [Octopus vulgaris]